VAGRKQILRKFNGQDRRSQRVIVSALYQKSPFDEILNSPLAMQYCYERVAPELANNDQRVRKIKRKDQMSRNA
jgi:hypothetical protein